MTNAFSSPHKKIIYGVTNRTHDPKLVKINDFLIDRSRITGKEKSLFFHSLQLLINSGVQFTRAIDMLAGRARNPRLQRILNTIAYDMENQGVPFSKALEKYPLVFSEYEVKMIKSGELTGKIKDSLESIAIQLQKNLKLEAQIRSAMIYPVTVLGAILLAGVVICLFVIPKFAELFAEFSAELPLFTKIVLNISNFLVEFWWLVFIAIWAGWQIFYNWKTSPEGKKKWHAFLLRAPLIGNLINNVQTLRIANNFSTLLKAGIPINKSLHVLSEIIPNVVIKSSIKNIEKNVENGLKIHQSFAKESALDPILAEILEIGEKSGNMTEVLTKVGEQYELEIDHQLKNLTTLIEPAIILIVGLAVIFMALSIMMPIFQLQEVFLQ